MYRRGRYGSSLILLNVLPELLGFEIEKMKLMLKYVVAIFVLSFPIIAISAPVLQAVNQTPYSIHIFPNEGMFVFYANVTSGDLPGCSGNNRWSIKTDKPGAKELISMIIAARTAGRTVTVMGDGTCNPDGYGYLVSYVYYN